MTGPEDDGYGQVGATGSPAVSAVALLPAGVRLDYAVDMATANGVVQLGLGDRAVRLIGDEDTFRRLAGVVATLLTVLHNGVES